MKKGLFILMAALVMLGVSCSDNDEIENENSQNEIAIPNDSHLFIGKWKIESIEDMGTVSDYTDENSTVTFYEDGRFAYTPYISKGIDGEVYGTYESSESLFQCRYECTENELWVHYSSSGIKNVYTYVFSDDNDTLRIVLTRRDVEGDICYFTQPTSPLIGKTLVLKKIRSDQGSDQGTVPRSLE